MKDRAVHAENFQFGISFSLLTDRFLTPQTQQVFFSSPVKGQAEPCFIPLFRSCLIVRNISFN